MPARNPVPICIARVVPVAGGLLVVALAACRGSDASAVKPALVATGVCLGRVCLGMAEKDAVTALTPGTATPPGDDRRHCYRAPDGAFYSFWVDDEDPGRRVIGVLATKEPHCSDPVTVADPGPLATCRGVRLGDPESFVAKLHRQAVEAANPMHPWPEAPEGTRQLDDTCGPGAGEVARTSLYLRAGAVAGLAIWEPDC